MANSPKRTGAGVARVVALTAVVLGTTCAAAQAPIISGGRTQAPQSVEQRLQRVEQLVSSRALMNLLQQVDGLRREVQALRGDNEVLSHRLDQMNKRMRDMYVDMDRRIQRGARAAPASGQPANDGGEVAAAGGAATGTAALDAQGAYKGAVDMLMAGNYADAIGAFEQFLATHGSSAYAGNARYWLAETYYQQGRYDDAMAAYQSLVRDHPDNAKVADGSLKIGFILDEQGKRKEAIAALEAVVKDYAGTSVEPLARQRLAEIQRR